MKSKEELKKELHELIDSIEDEETLNVLHDDIVPYATGIDLVDTDEEELTPEQEAELKAAIKEADEGKTMSLEEFYSRMARWRTK